MATIDINVGGLFQPSEVTVDQSNYDGNTLLNVNALSPNTTLNITNTDNTSDVLELSQTIGIGLLSTSTVNLGENANVKLTGLAGVNVGSTFNYNLGDGSTLEMTSDFISLGLGNTTNIDLGDEGTSTFIYDGSGVNVEISSYPNITGITAGDQIQVVGATSGEYVNGDLIFRNDLGFTVGRFNAEGLDPALVKFDGGKMSYACYLKGTNIATPDGEVKVEDLRIGDKVLTARGGVATVKWVGYRTLRKARIPAKDAIRAFPITFKKDSVAKNVPHRDVTVSPHHLVLINSSLIPAMLLVNGKTITQDFSRQSFQYFHVELDSFDILLADGLPAESYVDMGNRSMFENADTVALHPDFEAPNDGSRPELEGITVQRSGAAVEAVRKHLLKRAAAMTQSVRVSDPDVRVEVNGKEIRAQVEGQTEGIMRFVLPASAQTSDVRILSRSAIVRDTSTHARRDLRQIGVGLTRVTFEDAASRRDIDLMDSQLLGLHAPQDVHGVTMRWTNGAAVIPAALHNVSGPTILELHVLRTYSYWESMEQKAA